MSESTSESFRFPASAGHVLSEICRWGAREMLAEAIEAEVADWIASLSEVQDAQGHRLVVRNGYLPPRKIVTGLGEIPVRQPRVHDRRPEGQREKFTSQMLPPYLRKAIAVAEVVPFLYLKGTSTGDMSEALQSLLGPSCPGAVRFDRDPAKGDQGAGVRPVGKANAGRKGIRLHPGADGVHTNIWLEEDRQCILVLMGATRDGKTELIAMTDGHRESAESWKELLRDV
jgi:putative transposase